MDHRQASRFEANQPVTVTALGEHPLRFTATVKNASGRGLGLEMKDPILSGAAVRIELPDALFLGEVVFCRPRPGGYTIGVILDQMLSGLAELSLAVQEFVETGAEDPAASRVKR